MSEPEDAVKALAAPIIADLGYDLVRVQLSGRPGAQTLQIMAEDPATGQLTLAQCGEISRALDLPLDEADPIEGEYALEVSSPGIDRPLTRPKDWQKWTGHDVRLKLARPLEDGPFAGKVQLKGVILGLELDAAIVDVPGVGRATLPLDRIGTAKLVLTDRLIAASRPLDATGADETIEEADELPAENDNA
ncbi:ribosome maturation factor [Polymorphobacter sp.]|uniref:ribosome maturation factor n=1 Tax=Polymorphobacter sp. TaxID=1909290 RepID=UPI003F6F94B8